MFTGTFYCLYRGEKKGCVLLLLKLVSETMNLTSKRREKMGGMNRERKIEVEDADDEERESFR